jgi:hypothetical protein
MPTIDANPSFFKVAKELDGKTIRAEFKDKY